LPDHHEIVGRLRATEKCGIAGDFANQTREVDHAAEPVYTSRLRLGTERRKDHELTVTRDFIRHLGLGVEVEDVWPETWTGPEERQWAVDHVPRSDGRVTLALAPGVLGYRGKIYPPERYPSAVLEATDAPVDVVIFGSAEDRTVCARVAASLADCRGIESVKNLAGETTIGQLIEGLRRATVVLSVDAAPLHIATALGRPTVGIMGGGHFGRFYPWGDPELNRTAFHSMECYWCGWLCRYSTTRCVEEIESAIVARELVAAIGAARRTSIEGTRGL
jgi:ADP-heptose:LPS heptosyltransferase